MENSSKMPACIRSSLPSLSEFSNSMLKTINRIAITRFGNFFAIKEKCKSQAFNKGQS